MKGVKIPLPRKYWGHIIVCAVLSVLLFVNIFVTNGITGEKALRDFTRQDWLSFILFLAVEAAIGVCLFFFAVKAGKLMAERDAQVRQYYDRFLYDDIKPGEYDYVWFDFSGDARAKIVQAKEVYYLYADEFDYKTETWNPIQAVSVFSSLSEVKQVLFYEFDFYCEANTRLDAHGDEIFWDEDTVGDPSHEKEDAE